MAVRILYFAALRERVGCAGENVALPAGVGTVAGLAAWLAARSPAHGAAFADPAVVRAAVNQAFARGAAPVVDGDEVAFFPPVTGG